MSRKGKAKMKVPQAPKQENPLIIKGTWQVATGHKPWAQGCGRHTDKRFRRQGTKAQILKAALKD